MAARAVSHTYRPRVTELGRAVLLGTILFFLACLIIPAFGVLSALVTLDVMALIVGYIYRPRLAITVSYPQRIMAGETVCLRYTIQNLAHISAYNLTFALERLPAGLRWNDSPQTISLLRPDESIEVLIHISPEGRGRYNIPGPVCYSSFPLNLLQFAVPCPQEQPLFVLPVFYQLQIQRSFVETSAANDFSRSGMIAGVCPEYVGNRPFMPGDSRRRIDARAWARLATPAIKEFHEAYQSRVAFVLDTTVSRQQRQGPVPELEAAISLCASIAYSLDKDCQIEWLIAGPRFHSLFLETQIKRCDLIHDILAEVQPSQETPLPGQITALLDRFQGIVEVFFIFQHGTPYYQTWVQWAQRAGCRVKIIVIDSRPEQDIGEIRTMDHSRIQRIAAGHILKKQVISL